MGWNIENGTLIEGLAEAAVSARTLILLAITPVYGSKMAGAPQYCADRRGSVDGLNRMLLSDRFVAVFMRGAGLLAIGGGRAQSDWA